MTLTHRSKIFAVLIGHTLLRAAIVASGASALSGFFLAELAREGADIGAGTVGVVNSTLDVAVLFGAIPFGALIDRRSPRFVLVLGAIIGALATQLFGLTSFIGIFIMARALEGLGFAAVNPAVLAYLTDITEGDEDVRARTMSWFEMTLFAGIALGQGVAGLLWANFGRTAFTIMAGVYIVAGLIFYATTRLQAREVVETAPRSSLQSLIDVLKEPSLQWLAPAWVASNAIVGLWIAHIVFQLNGPTRPGQWLVGRLTPTQVSLSALIYALVFGAGVVLWGYVMNRIGRIRTMRLGFIGVVFVNFFFFLLNASTNWTAGARLALLFPYAIAVVFQAGFAPAALAFLADVAEASEGRGSAMGIYTVLLSVGNIIGALVGAIFASRYAINGLLIGSMLLVAVGFWSLSYLSEPKLMVEPAADAAH